MATIYNNDNLSKQQLKQINSFWLELAKHSNIGNITLLYRGDKLDNLFNRLGVYFDSKQPDFSQLLDRLYMVGEKSMHFRIDNFSGRKLSSVDYNDDMYDFIFDHLNKAVKSKNPIHQKFFDRNLKFKEFFFNKKNKANFLAFAQRSSDNERVFFKNRYLTLLHHLAYVNYKSKSHFLSTTTNYGIAQQFANSTKDAKGFVIHAWKPRSRKAHVTKGLLPNYIGYPYNWQKEVSILAGIFPHYIIGIEIPGEGMFYNPHIFKNSMMKETFIEGLSINQERFNEILHKTSYVRLFQALNDIMWEDEL